MKALKKKMAVVVDPVKVVKIQLITTKIVTSRILRKLLLTL